MTILIPAYEPDGRLLRLVRELIDHCGYPILLVDDGSGPRFTQVFQAAKLMGCHVLRHERNRGKGEALKTGFLHLIGHGEAEGVVCADCDGQHDTADICRVAQETLRRTETAILGSRSFTGRVPLKSRIGNSLTRLVFQASAGYRIQDTQTGLRGYPAAMMLWLCEIGGERFEYELNLLLAIKPAGWKIREIPIRTIYDPGNHSTHFRPIVDSVKVYLPFLKFSAASLAAFGLDFLLLMILSATSGNLLLSVVLARVFSSVFNYACNHKLVFTRKANGPARSAPRYFALALVILCLNYLLLRLMTAASLPLAVAKLVTEALLFVLSYQAQKHLVFGKAKIA